MGEYLLDVQDLKTYFKVKGGRVRAVDGVSFGIKPGEKVAIVGESGCGKSVTALSIMRLIPQPPGEYASGSVLFEDQDLLDFPESGMRKVRGARISMIFQDPMTCLNPTPLRPDRLMWSYVICCYIMSSVQNRCSAKCVEWYDPVAIC